jgi:predicted DNA-binding transcriptional regulator AlpA
VRTSASISDNTADVATSVAQPPLGVCSPALARLLEANSSVVISAVSSADHDELSAWRTDVAALILRLASLSTVLASVAPPPPRDRLLSLKEAADRAGVSLGWMYDNWRTLPGAVKVSHRAARISERGLERWLNARKTR